MTSHRDRVRPANVLGVPTIPPAAATRFANRVRGRLGRLAERLAPPPVAVLETLFGALDARALVVLCDLDVPDVLRRPMTIDELAVAVGAPSDVLTRYVRVAVVRGWIRRDRRGRLHPTRVSTFLRRDHPGGWRAWVELMGGDEISAAIAAAHPRRPGDPFASTTGRSFFDWMADHPERGAVFDAAMDAGGRMHALVLDAALDWGDVQSVCDVGGGTGALLTTLLDRRTALRGCLLDQPNVVARAPGHPRLDIIGGDFFGAVPDGHDRYLLVNVVHDWGDDDATRILRTVATAAGPHADVVVVDNIPARHPTDRIAAGTDLLMASLTAGGRERDADEMAALARGADLRVDAVVPLASGDLAHVLRAPAGSHA